MQRVRSPGDESCRNDDVREESCSSTECEVVAVNIHALPICNAYLQPRLLKLRGCHSAYSRLKALQLLTSRCQNVFREITRFIASWTVQYSS